MGKAKRLRKQREQESLVYPADARSFELKLSRAQTHLQEIEQQVEGWRKGCLDSLREEPDPNEPGYHRALIDGPQIDVQGLALRIGDFLQCLRSALDHLAFELATTFTSPLPDEFEKRSEFPVFGDGGGEGTGTTFFHQRRQKGKRAGEPAPTSGLAKIAGLDPRAQAVIESLQPYHRGTAFEDDPLWRLHELNRLDKHRLLHVVGQVMAGATMPSPAQWQNVSQLGGDPGQEWTLKIGGLVEPEGPTEVARWAAQATEPGQEMHVGFHPVLNVVFHSDTRLVGNLAVSDALVPLKEHIMGAVIPPLAAFLD